MRKGAPATLFVFVNKPCVALGLNRVAAEDVFEEYCAAHGIPVLRRVSGGGTVYHDEGNLNYSMCVSRRLVSGLISPRKMFEELSKIPVEALRKCGVAAVLRPISDLVVDGKKVSGNALKITKDAVMYHGTVLVSTPIEAIEATLKVPKERAGISHGEYVSNLNALGYGVTAEMLAGALLAAFESYLMTRS